MFAWPKWNYPLFTESTNVTVSQDTMTTLLTVTCQNDEIDFVFLKNATIEIRKFGMMLQKLKEAFQSGAISVQFNSGDVKSRLSMEAELEKITC